MVTTNNSLRYLSVAASTYFGIMALMTGFDALKEQDQIRPLPAMFDRREELALANKNALHRRQAGADLGMCVAFIALTVGGLAYFSKSSNKDYVPPRV